MLVPLTYGFSVRYAVPTGLLERLAGEVEPVVGLGWDDPELVEELDARGLEVLRLPDPSVAHDFRTAASRLDLVHERRLASPTSRIRRDRWRARGISRVRLIQDARLVKDRLLNSTDRGRRTAEQRYLTAVDRDTNVGAFERLLHDERIDAVLSFTPYHDQDVLALHAAHRTGRRSVVSVISFDNPTVRGRLPIDPTRVLVWNGDNADQVLRSHPGLDPNRVRVVGAPQFDLHRRADLVLAESEWRESLGLPEGRKVVLYGAGPSRLVPGEHRLVQVLDDAISAGRLPGDPVLLVRRHPNDHEEVWSRHASSFTNVVISSPWAATGTPMRSWPTEDDLRQQMSSLAHSEVHVNVCSSMTVDGAMFERPQVGPTFLPGADRHERSVVTNFYRQEHWRPVELSGGLRLVGDADELVAAVASGLEHPDRLRPQLRRLVEGVVTWPDGQASERLVQEVVDVLGESPDHAGGPGG